MKTNPKIKILALSLLFCFLHLTGFSTVGGPVKIDVLGFDSSTNTIYFTRTSWAECDCPTELYTYQIDTDSVEIITNWSPKYEFAKHRNAIIKSKGLDYLEQPDTTALPAFVRHSREPEVKYYNKVVMDTTIAKPFKITIFEKDYSYYQCYQHSEEPEIIHLKIDDDLGLLFIKFQGECMEGNWIDSLIFYSKKNGKLISKKLTANDVRPLDDWK
ncbi:hypothetical protein [uncultured Draconibacterium sp.]|uniref:hypothetical protein n=1 Tax=uncultured Draconibacterium sp. TaxID=1573823 RepID=UPI002AA6F0EB|nr:hypothetical protein [uncultured Draconibacterium sp.]